MQKLLHSSIFRRIKLQHFTHSSGLTTIPDDAIDNLNVSNAVLSIINNVHPMEPALDELSHCLNREVVISVLQSQAKLKKDPRICFRFFFWGSKAAPFRSGFVSNLIVDMLLSGDNGDSFDLYWRVLDELRNRKLSVSSNAFLVLILGYWRLKMAEKAVETFGRMKAYECKPDLAAYNVILHILVKKDMIYLALAVYNMMLKSNCRLVRVTYNVLIDGLFKNRMTGDACNLFEEMDAKGIRPNKITYTAVISGLCKENKLLAALDLFKVMIGNGISPDSAACNNLIDGFCKNGKIDDAFSLVKSFQVDGHNVGIKGYSCLMDALVKAKRIGEAEELFQKVLDEGLVPDLVLYTIMLHGLAEAGRMIDAMSMFRDMIGKGIMPDTQCYNVLIKGFCNLGLLDEARTLKLEISQHNQFPNTCTYTILICGFCRNGLLGEAKQIFDEMEKIGCNPSAVTFNALIDGLCKAGKLGEAQLMLCRMAIGKNQPLFLRLTQGADHILNRESLQNKVQNLVDSGSIIEAYKLLHQLADSGAVPNLQTYNILINGMCKAGYVDMALKLFEKQLKSEGLIPDSVTYATLVDGLQRVGRGEDAYKLYERMNEIEPKPSSSVYKTLMTWCCRERRISAAFGFWLKYLKSRDVVEDAALRSIKVSFEEGDLEKALRSILEIDIELVDSDLAFYSIWLSGLCQSDRVQEALKTFYVLEEFNVLVSAPACVNLIRALCFKGELNKAVDVFLYTMQKGYLFRRPLCNSLLQALLKSRDEVILALELLERMKSVGYDLNSHLYPSTKSLLPHIYSLTKTENVSSR